MGAPEPKQTSENLLSLYTSWFSIGQMTGAVEHTRGLQTWDWSSFFWEKTVCQNPDPKTVMVNLFEPECPS